MMTKRKITPPSYLAAVAVVLLGLFGRNECQAQVHTDWTGTKPEDVAVTTTGTADNSKNVFLYNVGKQKFLNRGGNWGTEAVLSEVGMEFEVITKTANSTTYYGFHSQFNGQGGVTPYLSFSEGGSTTTNFGTITSADKADYYVDQGGTAFQLEAVSYNDKTVYTMKHVDSSTTYYMAAGKASTSTSVADEEECISSYSTLPTDGTGYWILVTVEERENYIKQLSDTTVEQAPATFLMLDNDFARRSTDIQHWRYGTSSTNQAATAFATNENNTTLTSVSATYYVGVDDYDTSANGGLATANIKGASGQLSQTISDLPAEGWYEIHANVFTTTAGAAKLYAAVGDANSGPTTLKTEYIEKTAATAPTTITSSSKYSEAEAELNKTITQSGATVYPYQLVARVYVGKTGSTVDKLTMGVKVANGTSDTWTCIDNFQIYFIGQSGQSIYLDEEQQSVDDMNAQISSETTSTVYIHRSMVADKWNSLILPFDMTHNDIVNAFGVGTYVCEFKGATDESSPTTLYFDAVATIKANTPYIVKPTISEPTRTIAAEKVKGGVTTKLEKYSYYTIHKTFCFNGNKDAVDNKFPESIDGPTGKQNYTDAADNLVFHGTYVKKESQIPVNSYVIYAGDTDVTGSQGKWMRNGVASHSRAFRAWLQRTSTSTTAADVKEAKFCIGGIVDSDEDITAIDGTVVAPAVRTADSRVYNLCGQVVATDASQISELPSGLYIVGGKKMFVK